MLKYIQIHMGPKAYAEVSQNGLRPSRVAGVAGAAGGNKAIALAGLDQFLFGDFLTREPYELGKRELTGASIGSWRMACACLENPLKALNTISENYLQEDWHFDPKWKPKDVQDQFIKKLSGALAGEVYGKPRVNDLDAILNNPNYRLNVLVNKAKTKLSPKGIEPSLLGFGKAVVGNIRGRNRLSEYLERVVFHTGNSEVFSGRFDEIDTSLCSLSKENLYESLLASGTLPFISTAMNQIAGVGQGCFIDGGLTDVDLVVPFNRLDGLVLYPHYYGGLRQSWFDKFLPGQGKSRRYNLNLLENVVLISPTTDWISILEDAKIPDRSGLSKYGTDTAARVRAWRDVKDKSFLMAQEFSQWLENSDMSEVKPIALPNSNTFKPLKKVKKSSLV